MKDKIYFATAGIKTEDVSDYLYDCISECDENFDSLEAVKSYLEGTLDLVGSSEFYLNVLTHNRGLNFRCDFDYQPFDDYSEIEEYVKLADLHLINESYEEYIGIDDLCNYKRACEKAYDRYVENENY